MIFQERNNDPHLVYYSCRRWRFARVNGGLLRGQC